MKPYRLVSEEEGRDIDNNGLLRHAYGALEVKEFWVLKNDAVTYFKDAVQSGYSPPYARLIALTVNDSLDKVPHEKMTLDAREAIVFHGEALYLLNKIVTLEWLNLDSDD